MILNKESFKAGQSQKDLFTKVWNKFTELSKKYNNLTIYITTFDKRTHKQNKFYFFIVGKIAQEDGKTIECVHLSLKCLFLVVEDRKTRVKEPNEYNYEDWGKFPEMIEDLPSTQDLNKQEISRYWGLCARFGNAVWGLNLPLNPHEMPPNQYERYLEETEIK